MTIMNIINFFFVLYNNNNKYLQLLNLQDQFDPCARS